MAFLLLFFPSPRGCFVFLKYNLSLHIFRKAIKSWRQKLFSAPGVQVTWILFLSWPVICHLSMGYTTSCLFYLEKVCRLSVFFAFWCVSSITVAVAVLWRCLFTTLQVRMVRYSPQIKYFNGKVLTWKESVKPVVYFSSGNGNDCSLQNQDVFFLSIRPAFM